MDRICSIHQPSYWPYLGLFDKIASSHVFVFLDDVQYTKNEFKNRNRIFMNSPRSPQRDVVNWLTLPVRQTSLAQTIQQTEIPNLPTVLRKHLVTIRQAYGSTTGFKLYFPAIEELYGSLSQGGHTLSDVNVAVTELVIKWLKIPTEISGLSSAMSEKSSDPTQRLIDICKHVGANVYLAGAAGADYMQTEEFEKNGIRLMWQTWHPYSHPQAHSPEKFVPYLSCLDALFNQGEATADKFPSHVH